MEKTRRFFEKGEIATIITIASLVFLGVSTLASSFFVKNQQTTSTKAAGTCPATCQFGCNGKACAKATSEQWGKKSDGSTGAIGEKDSKGRSTRSTANNQGGGDVNKDNRTGETIKKTETKTPAAAAAVKPTKDPDYCREVMRGCGKNQKYDSNSCSCVSSTTTTNTSADTGSGGNTCPMTCGSVCCKSASATCAYLGSTLGCVEPKSNGTTGSGGNTSTACGATGAYRCGVDSVSGCPIYRECQCTCAYGCNGKACASATDPNSKSGYTNPENIGSGSNLQKFVCNSSNKCVAASNPTGTYYFTAYCDGQCTSEAGSGSNNICGTANSTCCPGLKCYDGSTCTSGKCKATNTNTNNGCYLSGVNGYCTGTCSGGICKVQSGYCTCVANSTTTSTTATCTEKCKSLSGNPQEKCYDNCLVDSNYSGSGTGASSLTSQNQQNQNQTNNGITCSQQNLSESCYLNGVEGVCSDSGSSTQAYYYCDTLKKPQVTNNTARQVDRIEYGCTCQSNSVTCGLKEDRGSCIYELGSSKITGHKCCYMNGVYQNNSGNKYTSCWNIFGLTTCSSPVLISGQLYCCSSL